MTSVCKAWHDKYISFPLPILLDDSIDACAFFRNVPIRAARDVRKAEELLRQYRTGRNGRFDKFTNMLKWQGNLKGMASMAPVCNSFQKKILFCFCVEFVCSWNGKGRGASNCGGLPTGANNWISQEVWHAHSSGPKLLTTKRESARISGVLPQVSALPDTTWIAPAVAIDIALDTWSTGSAWDVLFADWLWMRKMLHCFLAKPVFFMCFMLLRMCASKNNVLSSSNVYVSSQNYVSVHVGSESTLSQ